MLMKKLHHIICKNSVGILGSINLRAVVKSKPPSKSNSVSYLMGATMFEFDSKIMLKGKKRKERELSLNMELY